MLKKVNLPGDKTIGLNGDYVVLVEKGKDERAVVRLADGTALQTTEDFEELVDEL